MALRLVSSNDSPLPAPGISGPEFAADAELHDAYSRAVIGSVEAVSPSVVNIEVEHRRAAAQQRPRARMDGSGSGFVFTPEIGRAHV